MSKIWVMFKFKRLLLLISLFSLFLSLFFCNLVFAKNAASTDKSTLTVNPSSIPADGITTAIITVTVKDIYGNLLVGDHITLTSTPDSGLMINGSAAGITSWTAATNSSGQAIFTVKSNNATSHTDTLTASDVTDSPAIPLGSSTNNNVAVAFTIPTSEPSCSSAAPGSTPQLTSAVPEDSDKIMLTWTAATNPVSCYSLSYGTISGQYIYGNPNVGGQSTTSYTVGSLVKGTTYYFAMKAVNGCNSGSYSNEVSAVAGGSPTPTLIQEKDASSSASDLENDNTKQSASSNSAQNAPTDTPIPQSTDTPTPTPEITNGTSTNKIIIYGLVFIIVAGGIGGFCWWKFKNKKKTSIPTEENLLIQNKTEGPYENN